MGLLADVRANFERAPAFFRLGKRHGAGQRAFDSLDAAAGVVVPLAKRSFPFVAADVGDDVDLVLDVIERQQGREEEKDGVGHLNVVGSEFRYAGFE